MSAAHAPATGEIAISSFFEAVDETDIDENDLTAPSRARDGRSIDDEFMLGRRGTPSSGLTKLLERSIEPSWSAA